VVRFLSIWAVSFLEDLRAGYVEHKQVLAVIPAINEGADFA
jgi:hypothetical protein